MFSISFLHTIAEIKGEVHTDLRGTPCAFIRFDEFDQLIHILVKALPSPVFVQ